MLGVCGWLADGGCWQYACRAGEMPLEPPEKTDDNGQQQTVTDAAFGCGEKRLWVRRETALGAARNGSWYGKKRPPGFTTAAFAWGESRGGAPPPSGGGSNVAAITRHFFAYFLFPLKRK